MGRAQQLLMEAWADSLKTAQPWPTSPPAWGAFPPAFFTAPESTTDPMSMLSAGAENWAKGLQAWGDMLGLKGISKRAVFVIDKAGIIRYREVTPTPGDEPNYAKVHEAVENLQ